jgi:predicted ester cyclase
MTEADNKTLARRLLEEVVNSGDVSRLPEFLAPDYRVRHTDQIGIEAARQHLLTFHHCYPDLHVTVDGQVAEDDIVVTWYTMRGTHLGEWGGIKPTNKVLTLRGVNVQRFRDGRILEAWGGANTLEAFLEIGAIRLPGGTGD